MDCARISAELVKTWRGKRSQTALSRRLGYRSNVVHHWERGRSWPTAAGALVLARHVGVDLGRAYSEFYRVAPRWLSEFDPATPAGVAAFLRDLKGNTSMVDLARYTGYSRFAIARWLRGDAEPRLPEFLRLIECASLRVLDYLEQLVDPRKLPSIRADWTRLQAARRIAYDEPWSQAVLRALELESYSRLSSHERGWISRRIGMSQRDEERCLRALDQSGQIELADGRWRLREVLALDTRRDPQAARRLRVWWARQAIDRVERGSRGMMYNVFGVSRADLERLRELQKAYLTELRTIVAQSTPVEEVVVGVDLLVDLGDLGESGSPDTSLESSAPSRT